MKKKSSVKKSESALMWVVKQTKGKTALSANLRERCYAKLGDPDNYGFIYEAMTFATKKEAAHEVIELGEKPIRVRVTVEEV